MGKVGLPEVVLVHRIGVSIRRPLGVGVGDLISFHPFLLPVGPLLPRNYLIPISPSIRDILLRYFEPFHSFGLRW